MVKRFLRGGHDEEQLTMEEDAVKSHTHSTKDAYMRRWSCPAGTTEIYVERFENDHTFDDRVCERQLISGSTGGVETKPKNINVIFISYIIYVIFISFISYCHTQSLSLPSNIFNRNINKCFCFSS